MDAPEFSRLYRRDEIGAMPLAFELTATADECAALAKRFDLIAIDALSGTGQVLVRDKALIAEGQMSARVTQACVVTGDAVRAALSEPFKIRFIDETAAPENAEIELSFDEYDDMPVTGETIDLGEAIAQSMVLALPPFPRGPNAARILREAGVVAEGEETRGAFAALKDLLK